MYLLNERIAHHSEIQYIQRKVRTEADYWTQITFLEIGEIVPRIRISIRVVPDYLLNRRVRRKVLRKIRKKRNNDSIEKTRSGSNWRDVIRREIIFELLHDRTQRKSC